MKQISKQQYREFAYMNRELTERVIKARRQAIQEANGKRVSNNISAKALLTLNAIFNMILETGYNELMLSKSKLTELLDTTSNNTNRDLKTYFRGYGLGEYSYSNKYNIAINGESKSIKRETHYYIYINKETLELMKSVIEVEGLDFDSLIAQIPECERKCAEIGGKTETEINVLNYVDDDFIMQHKINIEKNLFTKEGHYSKETNIIDTEDNTVVEVSKKENDFIPKQEEETEEEYIEEQEEAEDFSLSDNNGVDAKDAYRDKCIKIQRSRVSLGSNISVKPVERVIEEEIEEEEVEEEIVEEVDEEEVMSLLAEVKDLQMKSKSRALAMKISKIEAMLSSEDRNLGDIQDQLTRYKEQFSEYAKTEGNDTRMGVVRKLHSRSLGMR